MKIPLGRSEAKLPTYSSDYHGIMPNGVTNIMLDMELREEIRAEIVSVTHIDPEKTNSNSKPLYVGPLMLLSDQDLTALKHHVLSSAVMGTVFVGLIATISNPDIPLILRIFLTGGVLSGMQAVLVGVTNLLTTGAELWDRHHRPLPFKWCGRCCMRLLERLWDAYVSAHTVHLSNGATVWVDGYMSVLLDAPDTNQECESES